MSTRSHIGIWNEDGSLDVIYCHWEIPVLWLTVAMSAVNDPEDACLHLISDEN